MNMGGIRREWRDCALVCFCGFRRPAILKLFSRLGSGRFEPGYFRLELCMGPAHSLGDGVQRAPDARHVLAQTRKPTRSGGVQAQRAGVESSSAEPSFTSPAPCSQGAFPAEATELVVDGRTHMDSAVAAA